MTKNFAIPSVYGAGNTTKVGAQPLRPLAHFAPKGVALGWEDCAESFGDWWDLLQSPPLAEPRSLGVTKMFNLLGQPVHGADSYEAPWNDYLDYLADKEWFQGIGETSYV